MKWLVHATAVALATLLGVFFVWKLRFAILLFAGTVTVAATAEPAVDELVRRRLPRGLAIALVYGLGFAVIGGALVAIAGELPDELGRAVDQVTRYYNSLRQPSPGGSGVVTEILGGLPEPTRLLDGDGAKTFGGNALGLTGNVLEVAGAIAVMLIMSLFWSASAKPFERLWLSLLSAPRRILVRDLWHALRDSVGAQMRGQLAQILILTPLMWIALKAFGVAYPLLAALCIAILQMIPLVGPLVALLVAFVSGANHSLVWGAAAGATTLALLVWLRLVVARRLAGMRRESAFLSGAVLLGLWDAGGLYALLVAAPVTTLIAIVAERLRAAPPPTAAHDLQEIERQMMMLGDLLLHLPAPQPELQNVADRLAQLVQEIRG